MSKHIHTNPNKDENNTIHIKHQQDRQQARKQPQKQRQIRKQTHKRAFKQKQTHKQNT